MNLPTSDIDDFKKQMQSPNTGFTETRVVEDPQLKKVQKNLVLSYNADYTGCGFIRNIIPMTYLNSVFGKTRNFQTIVTPHMIFQPDVLEKTRSILFQRTMAPSSVDVIKHYKKLQQHYRFKMVYDIDDFIWDGPEEGETIPEYNFGKPGIDKDVQDAAIENMKMMDVVCVSTQFLGDYIASRGVDKDKIQVIHNTLPAYLWGDTRVPKRTEPIKKPTIVWSASPTHWHNDNKLAGDMDNAWKEWIINAVNADKINYIQMGGLPWFFESIKDKITVIDWVNSLHYPKTIKSLNADFGIAPLVPNYFNYSKSAIKYQEYCVAGIVGIGTVFDNGKPSPYDVSITTTSDSITVDEIDDLIFNKLSDPDVYNNIIDRQYQQIIDENWTTESAAYINKLTSIL